MKSRQLLVMISAYLLMTVANASDVMVAVASNFSAPMQKIAESFQKETGHRAVLAFGSSGSFYAQIKNGAPFEVFLSADHETVDRLVAEGFGLGQSQFTYAIGKLVLWSAKEGYVDESGLILKKNTFKKIAIANPKLAPYGLAALQTLTKLNLMGSIGGKLITGENVTQTYQFVSTQNVELGFVALSQVYKDGRISNGSGWIVPSELHEPIRQDAVILKTGKSSEAARALISYLKTDQSKAIMKNFGYSD